MGKYSFDQEHLVHLIAVDFLILPVDSDHDRVKIHRYHVSAQAGAVASKQTRARSMGEIVAQAGLRSNNSSRVVARSVPISFRVNAQTFEFGLQGGAVNPQSLRRAVDSAQLAVT